MGSLNRLNCQHVKRISLSVLIPAALFFNGYNIINAQEDLLLRNKVTTIVIDAGHGGMDPGALGNRSREKDITLKIALKLGNYIKDNFPDVKVIYTRDRDIFVPLYERADIANKNKADLFISIHANASPKKYIYGAETYVMGESKNDSNFEVAKAENAVITLEKDYSTKYEGFDPNSIESYIIFSLMQKTHLEQSLNIAGKIQDQFRERARRNDRGVKQEGFLVLWRTGMPSVLVEAGYISHPDEEKYISSETGQEYLASAIYRAFRSYKEEIENSSNFDTRALIENSREEKELTEEKNENTYFKIQLFTSRKRISLEDKVFKKYDLPEEFTAGSWYKYAVGNYSSYEEANVSLKKLRDKYPDAFIIAVRDTQVIQVTQIKQNIKN